MTAEVIRFLFEGGIGLIVILLFVSAYFIWTSKVFLLDEIKKLQAWGEGIIAFLTAFICGFLFFGFPLSECCWLLCGLVVCGSVQKMALDNLHSNMILWFVDHPFGKFIAQECDDEGLWHGRLSIDGCSMEALTMDEEELSEGCEVIVGVYLLLNRRKYPDEIRVYSLVK